MSTDSRRLSILTAQEVDDLYGLPRFTEEDRRLYFALSPSERDLVDGVYTISVAVHLILQLFHFPRQIFFSLLAQELGRALAEFRIVWQSIDPKLRQRAAEFLPI